MKVLRIANNDGYPVKSGLFPAQILTKAAQSSTVSRQKGYTDCPCSVSRAGSTKRSVSYNWNKKACSYYIFFILFMGQSWKCPKAIR